MMLTRPSIDAMYTSGVLLFLSRTTTTAPCLWSKFAKPLYINKLMFSHPIGSFCSRFCQRLDYQISIIRSPSPHRLTRGRVYNTLNAVGDVHLLSTLIM
ncbi:hypothetical protein EDB84DRAFT_1491340 [Lactarius hengduanensis]|nr:hypothetical protein EDB84DRAFT_1491340 [Lactarius hengduanensis]